MKSKIRKTIKVKVIAKSKHYLWYELGKTYKVLNHIVFDFSATPGQDAFFEMAPGFNSILVRDCEIIIPPKKQGKR